MKLRAKLPLYISNPLPFFSRKIFFSPKPIFHRNKQTPSVKLWESSPASPPDSPSRSSPVPPPCNRTCTHADRSTDASSRTSRRTGTESRSVLASSCSRSTGSPPSFSQRLDLNSRGSNRGRPAAREIWIWAYRMQRSRRFGRIGLEFRGLWARFRWPVRFLSSVPFGIWGLRFVAEERENGIFSRKWGIWGVGNGVWGYNGERINGMWKWVYCNTLMTFLIGGNGFCI